MRKRHPTRTGERRLSCRVSVMVASKGRVAGRRGEKSNHPYSLSGVAPTFAFDSPLLA